MERNHYLLSSGDHVKTSRSFLASYYATTHPQQSSLSLTPATFRMLSLQHTFLPTYPWQPSLMLFPVPHTLITLPRSLPGSLSPRRLQHHTPQCNPRYKRLKKKRQSLNPKFPTFKGSNFGTPGCAKMLAMRALASAERRWWRLCQAGMLTILGF